MANYNPFSLEGKMILVTGASSGIGQATAIECSKMGARVVVTGRNEARLKATYDELDGNGHLSVVAELTEDQGVDAIVGQVPVLDGLVLCAGRGMTLPLMFCSKDKYSELFDVNFNAPVELLRQLLKKKKVQKGGSIVFVASIAGNQGRTSPGNAVYGASKAALVSTMRYFARELGHKKIRANSVNPGMTKTPLITHGSITQEQYEADMKQYPLQRYGEPVDIARGIIYLLSDASSWVTGHSLVIDGGCTI